MDYVRHSSQPATIDLIRADLAEIWSIDGSESASPERTPSVPGISDMLDLEYIPTPGPRPSKRRKKDPLPDLLADVLNLSPCQNGEEQATNKSLEQPQDKKSSIHYERPTQCGRVAAPANIPSDSISGPESPANSSECCLNTRLEPDSPIPQPATKRSKHKHSVPSTTVEELPSNHPVSKPNRRRQRDGKSAPAPTARKGAEEASREVQPYQASTNLVQTKTIPKEERDRNDLFDLSDATDTDSEWRPKKRQAKQSLPKKPRAPARNRSRRAAKSEDSPTLPTRKLVHVPKEPARDTSEEQKMDHKPIHVDGVGLAGQDASEVNEVSRQNAKDGPLGTPMVDSMSMFDRHDASKNYVLANPAKQPTTSPHRSDPPSEDLRGRVPRTSEPFDVIALSSQSPTTEYVVTAPTSPMFVERSHEHMAAEGVAGVSLSDKRSGPNQETPALSAIERSSPSRITPPSTQPRAQGHDGEIKRRHTEHHLPSRIIDAFLSDDQQQAKSSPSTVLEPEFCSKQSLSPEEAWKQAVEDGSPPAILHRIITLLHRSLKPREEVVRDIATDYQKNAISLLETLSARHEEEKAKAAAALRKASRSAFSICSSAKQDIVVLVNTLRGMNVTQTAETIRRPGLAQKLDALSRLCQAELSNSTQDAPTENDASGASENNLNSLTETYRRRLVEAVRRPDALASGASDVVRSQVDDFMKRCLLADEVKEVHCTKGKQAGTSVKNADDALEAFLEGIIGTLQESKGRTVCNQPATKDLVAIDSDTSDLNVLA